MKKSPAEPIHVWLVMIKAFRAISRYGFAGMRHACLGESDFRVLEVLLHKGPMPVNAMGPLVDLNPGSISVAVDRLFARGLVTRTENPEDRRIRMVELTKPGKDLIAAAFKKHTADIAKAFAKLSPRDLRQLEALLKKAGLHAESLSACPGTGTGTEKR